MKEAYVKFETAKLFKEKGFCEENIYCYYQNDSTDVLRGECKFNWNIYDDSYSAPTQQMAMRWLREEEDIDIIPVIKHKQVFGGEAPFKLYSTRVYNEDGNILKSADDWHRSYEDAVEAALEYCLKNII